MHRTEVAGDICLRKSRPTQGCRADYDGDDDDNDDICLRKSRPTQGYRADYDGGDYDNDDDIFQHVGDFFSSSQK